MHLKYYLKNWYNVKVLMVLLLLQLKRLSFWICYTLTRLVTCPMNELKKWFPVSFDRSKSLVDVLIGVVIYLVIGLLAGLLIGFAGTITGWIPVVGSIVGIILTVLGYVVEAYNLVGIVLLILSFLKVIK